MMRKWKTKPRITSWLDPSCQVEKFGAKVWQALVTNSFLRLIYFNLFFFLIYQFIFTDRILWTGLCWMLGSIWKRHGCWPQAINLIYVLDLWWHAVSYLCLYLQSTNEVWMRYIGVFRRTEKVTSRLPGVFRKGQREMMAPRRIKWGIQVWAQHSRQRNPHPQRHRDEKEHGVFIRLLIQATNFIEYLLCTSHSTSHARKTTDF